MAKLLTLALGVFAVQAAHSQQVDTSEWSCEFCPFATGTHADLSIGAGSVSDDSAYFGDASGYSEEGAFVAIDGDGSITGDTHQLSWHVEDLGLDSRYAELRGGRQGTFGYEVAYRQLPHHRYFTSDTIFRQASNDSLSLPAAWVKAPLTSGFTELDANLMRRNIESERQTWLLGGEYLASGRIAVSASLRREERDGVDLISGSYFTQSSHLPGPFDYVTDIGELGVRYSGDNGFIALDYYLSQFDNNSDSLTWESPFTTVPGAEFGRLARAPDNDFMQLSLSGNYRFASYSTVVAYSLAAGRMQQDANFLPYTINGNLSAAPLPRSNLDADVDTRNVALSLTSRIIDKGRVKVSYRFDERDSNTAQDMWTRIIADSFVSVESETNIPYSFERAAFSLSGEYRLFDSLRVSGGYDRKEVDRDFQEVAEQTEDSGWGRLRWQPNPVIQLSVRGGASERDIDRYNEDFAVMLGQNPLLRKYHLAYRYRRFGELTIAVALPEVPVSLTFKGSYADDEYSQSRLGLLDGDDLQLAADLSWSIDDNKSLYLTGSYQNLESLQAGSEQFDLPDWRATNRDDFYTYGAGFRAQNIADRFDFEFDYLRSDGTSEILLTTATAGISAFPDLESTLDYLRARLTWQRSERSKFDFSLRYQRLESEDWALQNVEPATIPEVLTLGADPYDDDLLIVGVGFRYSIGGTSD
ncbi:MAG: MtrB/PioB family decaheme-associated outer membrane protein [Woeseiaceae bacterium]|nr:MtrB/PioB family decaheme-associated outer membrane protein [Woeseiaceae bacterium]